MPVPACPRGKRAELQKAVSVRPGLQRKERDMKRQQDKEVSQQPPLAISAGQLAAQLGVSLRHVRRADSAGLVPKPIRIGRSVRWPVDEIRSWLKAGAPDRRAWEQVKERQNGRSRR